MSTKTVSNRNDPVIETRDQLIAAIAKGEKAKGKDIHQSWGYRGFNQFAVTLTERSRPDDHLALILERRGLFTWKLAAVDLQTEAGA